MLKMITGIGVILAAVKLMLHKGHNSHLSKEAMMYVERKSSRRNDMECATNQGLLVYKAFKVIYLEEVDEVSSVIQVGGRLFISFMDIIESFYRNQDNTRHADFYV
ncbi:hypothetical protein BDC45DRAFT_540842 [Circinella umbellata]|nr:hypothetical protein BDC45DRAFT_540842 [Circinella umbellata]